MVTSPASGPRPAPLEGVGRVLVVGSGSSGIAAARLLDDCGVRVLLVDERQPDPSRAAPPSNVEVRRGPDVVSRIDEDIDLVVPSPGVPERAAVLAEAQRRGLPIWSEPELALRLRPHHLLAITGTNGKTSTTELLAAIVAASGREALACGNIGLPLSEAVTAADDDTVLVAELSSFQLRFAGTLRPAVGVLLNLAPDHLDWHADESAYHAAKARLWEAQQPDDWAVVNADDPTARALRDASARGRWAEFSGVDAVEIGVGVEGGQLVARTPDRPPTGLLDLDTISSAPHRVANAAAAASAAVLAGVDPEVIGAVIREHRPGRHRFETVATSRDGVRYIDDSKATNPHAARAALRAAGPCVWIAGGLAKGVDLGVLGGELGHVRAAVLIGEAADELERICSRAGVAVRRAHDMEQAVELAAGQARDGEVVLLSPACASFDQFRDYAERGERFTAAARAVVGRGGHDQEERP